MKKLARILILIAEVILSLVVGLFVSGAVSEFLNMRDDSVFSPMTIICIAVIFILCELLYRKHQKQKANEKDEPIPTVKQSIAETVAEPVKEQAETKKPSSEYFNELRKRMSGSLVALYKETHEEKYNIEYLRRLQSIGFTDAQANNMFMFELMILKYDSRAILCDPKYIQNNYFDLKTVPFPQEDHWYAEHQMFLMSEIVKIWDEAEYLWQSGAKNIENEDVKKRIHSITRYGGGKMFLDYMDMMEEKSHTPMPLLQAYVRGEQDLLWLYKWKKISEHPYAPK